MISLYMNMSAHARAGQAWTVTAGAAGMHKADSQYRVDPKKQNDFYIGNLLPDAVSPKKRSHFYDPAFLDRMIFWIFWKKRRKNV